MSAWVEFSFGIYCWVHLPSRAPKSAGSRHLKSCSVSSAFTLRLPLVLLSQQGVAFKVHIWALLTNKASTLRESFSLTLGLFSFTT